MSFDGRKHAVVDGCNKRKFTDKINKALATYSHD